MAASPDIAGVVAQLAGEVVSGSRSCRVAVTAVDPADVISSWKSDPADRPDVWIPDSSLWLSQAASAGLPVPTQSVSLATSPVVYALSAAAAARLAPSGPPPTFDQLLASRLTPSPIRLGLPDPQRSASSIFDLAAVQTYVSARSRDRSALTWAVESTPLHLPIRSAQLLTRLVTDPATALPATEQALWQYNRVSGAAAATAVYNPSTGPGLDYPYAVMGSPTTPAGNPAAALLAGLQSSAGRDMFLDNGFRDSRGRPGSALGSVSLVSPTGSAPTPAAVAAVLRSVAVINEPSRLLAVIDVSGSMVSKVQGTNGSTRLDLARSAPTLGLALYPLDSEVGVWEFSRNLTGNTDYRELVPVGPLTALVNGVSGEKRIASALAGVEVNPDGGTGLYDTTLAAVRAMQASWDPHRVNAVLILSDGQNDDVNGITLTKLLSTLAQERNTDRPVPVITIGLGPDSDVSSLGQISTATGGAAYVARDPRDIGGIFLDAVGQRLCRPHC